jgi:hypothetical protein
MGNKGLLPSEVPRTTKAKATSISTSWCTKQQQILNFQRCYEKPCSSPTMRPCLLTRSEVMHSELFLAPTKQHTISPHITMICSNFGWGNDSVNLLCLGQSCGRHDNNFYRSCYRSSTDSNRLPEIHGIWCCPYYLKSQFFLFLSTLVCIAVLMVSFKTLLSYSHISNYQWKPPGCYVLSSRIRRAYSGALLFFHAYRGYVPWYLTYDWALGTLWFAGVMGVGAWAPGTHKWWDLITKCYSSPFPSSFKL